MKARQLGAQVNFGALHRDTYANQYLESMGLSLPILTLDHHGAPDFIPATAGIKVPMQSAEATAAALARTVEHFYDYPAELKQMGRAGVAFATNYTLKKLVAGLYQQAAELAPELAGLGPRPQPVATDAAASV